MNVLFIDSGLRKQPHLRGIPNTGSVQEDAASPGHPHLAIFGFVSYSSLLKGLWSLIFPWQYFCLSFIKKHCQQHILTISFSFLIWAMTTNHTHKSCGIIGKWPWWYDSFLSWECKCFASWGFAFFSSFNRNNLGKETVWSTKEGGATETLKISWAHIISFIKIHT